MNRKLLALSVAAALVAPATASAVDVSVYGRLHLALSQFDNDADTSLNLSSNSSRLGVKGSHDLGNGLTGIFQIESGLNADTGGGELATRNTFAGIKGGFGTLRAGQFDTAVKDISGSVDFFSDQIGDNESLDAIDGFNRREDNIIGYTSPSFGGVAVDLQYSTNTDAGAQDDAVDNDTWVAAVSYKSKQLYAALGYQALKSGTAADEPSVIRLGAYYDFGSLRISGFAQQLSSDVSANEADTYGLGARYTFGNFAVKGQYYTTLAEADNADADLFAVGGEYKLAKNLTAYLDYALVSNDSASSQRPWDALSDSEFAAPAAGQDGSAFSVGAIYNF